MATVRIEDHELTRDQARDLISDYAIRYRATVLWYDMAGDDTDRPDRASATAAVAVTMTVSRTQRSMQRIIFTEWRWTRSLYRRLRARCVPLPVRSTRRWGAACGAMSACPESMACCQASFAPATSPCFSSR